MIRKFESIVHFLISADSSGEPPVKLSIADQFNPDSEDKTAIAQSLNAAFLIALSGTVHPLCNEAVQYLDRFESHQTWGLLSRFYKNGLDLIHSEIRNLSTCDKQFGNELNSLYERLSSPQSRDKSNETIESVRAFFFPEGSGLCNDREERIAGLRKKRKVTITRLNPSPVTDPAAEILFTSNILITVPPASKEVQELPISVSLKDKLRRAASENQKYWYDHPVPVGTPPDRNEVLYGLEGMDHAIEIEKQRGIIGKDEKVSCALSVSVTHEGLQSVVKEYLEDAFKKNKTIQHLEIYIFTEVETKKIVDDILLPAAKHLFEPQEANLLHAIFGVDGEYGRHYSFLKAIAAIWQVFIQNTVKGTFKIDLDQVFPQTELIEQSGSSAIEHLMTPLWGAEGTDNEGRKVDLGMIAGALVNKKDIGHSLFTPDVCFPPHQMKADELVFFSPLPQALSTEAEMMTRYTATDVNGTDSCIQRVHVTGGTCGILVSSLRRYRPFTPTFIGRAEDQAYILSVLYGDTEPFLRYVHKDGLIMRHDKEAFAGEAIQMAATGKLIGDYVRTLMFSYYVKALPWPVKKIKTTIDPFTGCFVSRLPLTVVYLRFALKASSFFHKSPEDRGTRGIDFLESGSRRLHETVQYLTRDPNPLIAQYEKEKQGWDLFFRILDRVEEGIKAGDPFSLDLQAKARVLVENCRVQLT